MVTIIIDSLELEKIKHQVNERIMSDINAINYYIDNIFIAGETFKYTENGSVGLMTDDYRLLMLESAGSIYSK